jgi:hypothetical protein
MTDTKKMCAGTIFRDYRRWPCSLVGKHEHEGRFYCKKHHPPSVVEANKKKDARHAEEWKVRQLQWRLSANANALLQLVKDALEDETEFDTEWDKAARELIEKIEGGTHSGGGR